MSLFMRCKENISSKSEEQFTAAILKQVAEMKRPLQWFDEHFQMS
jgi:hypothetical protein